MSRLIHKARGIGLTELVGSGKPVMDQLLERLRDDNLFYPDPALARAKAESHRRYYTVSTAFSPEQVDQHIDHLFYQLSAARPINLSRCPLSRAVSLAVKSM